MTKMRYSLAAAAIAAMGFSSCSKDYNPVPNTIEEIVEVKTNIVDTYISKDVTSEILGDQKILLYKGNEIQIAKISDPEHSEVLFISDDPEIISVDQSGKIKALDYGKATIYAQYNNEAIAKYEVSSIGVGIMQSGDRIFEFDMVIKTTNDDGSYNLNFGYYLGESYLAEAYFEDEGSKPEINGSEATEYNCVEREDGIVDITISGGDDDNYFHLFFTGPILDSSSFEE